MKKGRSRERKNLEKKKRGRERKKEKKKERGERKVVRLAYYG